MEECRNEAYNLMQDNIIDEIFCREIECACDGILRLLDMLAGCLGIPVEDIMKVGASTGSTA
jgi:hypothetical protein